MLRPAATAGLVPAEPCLQTRPEARQPLMFPVSPPSAAKRGTSGVQTADDLVLNIARRGQAPSWRARAISKPSASRVRHCARRTAGAIARSYRSTKLPRIATASRTLGVGAKGSGVFGGRRRSMMEGLGPPNTPDPAGAAFRARNCTIGGTPTYQELLNNSAVATPAAP